MRQDVEIHINTGDVVLDPQNSYKLRQFRWVSNPSGLSRYIYGEIDIPSIVTENSIRNNGFYFTIPYTPKYKEFMIRIRRVYDNGNTEYVKNLSDGTDWFVVQVGMYGQAKQNAFASQLITISESFFFGKIESSCIGLYSFKQSDFNIIAADRQNANLMLACNPSNNYRYPVSGVGLVRWINAVNINKGNLAEIMQREFLEDGVIVKEASYNYELQEIDHLELDTSNAN